VWRAGVVKWRGCRWTACSALWAIGRAHKAYVLNELCWAPAGSRAHRLTRHALYAGLGQKPGYTYCQADGNLECRRFDRHVGTHCGATPSAEMGLDEPSHR
jgi:hypothetical protein